MKENALDVLMYLFKNYIDGDLEYVPDRESLEDELIEAGFPDRQINQAFNWLDELASGEPPVSDTFPQTNSIRIYTAQEMQLLDLECRGFLHFLEQSKVISPEVREVIIDRVMALEGAEIDIDRLKWIIVMVMFNLPEHDSNYEWLENMVFESAPENMH